MKITLLLALFALIGMAAADEDERTQQLEKSNSAYDNPTISEEKSLKFNFEQSVRGTGFFDSYKYALMPDIIGTEGGLFNGVEAANKAHGSGNIETDSTIYAESSYSNKTWINGAIDEDGEEIDDEEESTCQIQVKQDSKMTYSPLVMGIGKSYFNRYPVVFNSLLKEEDWLKNRNRLNSLTRSIDQAHGLYRVLDAKADADINSMKIEEDLVDGRADFGVLQLDGTPVDEEPEEEESEEGESDDIASDDVPKEEQGLGPAMNAWKKPLIEIDEHYVGSYHIEKNWTLSTVEEEEEDEDSWLSCCYGRFNDLGEIDAKDLESAKGIFDCTCFRVPDTVQHKT